MATATTTAVFCLWDALDQLAWTEITLTAAWSGSYSFYDGAGTQSGTVSGTSELVLTRVPFDPTLAPTDAGQGLTGKDFAAFTSRCQCPQIILPDPGGGSLTFSGTGVLTETGLYEPDDLSGDITFTDTGGANWSLQFPDGPTCDDGTMGIQNVACERDFASTYFDTLPNWMLSRTPFDYGPTGTPYTEDYDFDIVVSATVVGTQTVTLTVTIT